MIRTPTAIVQEWDRSRNRGIEVAPGEATEDPGEAPELSRLTGEFTDPRLEHAYRLQTWEDRQARFRFVGFLGAGFYLAAIALDLLQPGLERVLPWLVTIRVVVAAGILFAVLFASRLKDQPRTLDRHIATVLLAVVAGTLAILSLKPQSLMTATVAVLVLVLVSYVFVPVRATLVLLSGATLSVVFLVVLVASRGARREELSVVVFYLLLVNLLGVISNRHMRITRRRRYLTLLAERRATAELRLEVAARVAAERQLAESEARFRSLVELSPDPILVHRDGRVLYVNPAGLRLVGADSPEPFVGGIFLDFIHPDDRAGVVARQHRLASGAAELPAAEVRLLTLDGRELACEVLSGPTVYGSEPAIQSVVRDITVRKRLESELIRLATTDSLTGIANRRSFFEQLEREWARARRHARTLSLMMFDLDHFKHVNDSHGHAVGDLVLAALVDEARGLLRADDVLGRLGGEEFAILLPEVDLQGAAAAAERLRERLGARRVEAPAGPVRCTVSVGAVEARVALESPDVALKRADDALYEAKRTGRNRVCTG